MASQSSEDGGSYVSSTVGDSVGTMITTGAAVGTPVSSVGEAVTRVSLGDPVFAGAAAADDGGVAK